MRETFTEHWPVLAMLLYIIVVLARNGIKFDIRVWKNGNGNGGGNGRRGGEA